MNRNRFDLIIASRYWNCFTKKNLTQQTFLVFQDVFKTYSRRIQDVFARRLVIMSSRRLGRQKYVTLKTSSKRRQDVFSTS